MRKITDFIVNKRYLILVVFILLAIISAIISKQVNINDDMTKYLPSTSETRKGMDIMEKEFPDAENSSSFKIMFKGLTQEKKEQIFNELQEIEKVSSVDYDETEKYNKDDYTLYIISVDNKKDSEDAKQVYNTVLEKYEDYDIETSGEISMSNMDILPTWILVVAISGVFIILIIMCESYIEPILFLFSILIAVLLNNGTNIIFDSVSNITSSISAILQLALSMDYSIMLMNRFKQEKENESDKIQAMKNALYHSFKSISSSSVTTIVGLIALVFMSFTIGKDLGLVLAKGVLLSLISIFCILPGLILIFDKIITKTTKKTLNIKLNKLGSISYKIKYPLTFIFLLVFAVSFLLKGNLNILYTASELDEVSKVFGTDNQIAVIYKNEDEEKISKYLENIKQGEKVEEVLAYGNTINEKLNKEQLVEKLKELGEDINIEDYLLKIIYYKYYNPDENNQIAFDEMVKFIQNEVYNNPKTEEQLDQNIKDEIEKLSNFTDQSLSNKKRTAGQISNILGIKKENIDDILVYYNSKNNNLELTINDFINFINNKVLTDAKYGKNINQETKNSLAKLNKFIDKNTIETEKTSKEMSSILGISENDVGSLYTYYTSLKEITVKLTLSEFSNFVLTKVVNNETYSNMFNAETINTLKMLQTFSNTSLIQKEMNIEELSGLLGIDKEIITKLLVLKYMNLNDQEKLGEFASGNIQNWKSTPYELINIIITNKENEEIKNNINQIQMSKLNMLLAIMENSINNKSFTYNELAEFINSDVNQIKSIYSLYTLQNTETKLTPMQFVEFVLEHKEDDMLKEKINASTISNLNLLKTVMLSTKNNTKYSSSKISSLLGMEKAQTDLLYGLYISKNVNKNQTISLNTLVNFIVKDVMNNKDFSNNFDKKAKSELEAIQKIIKSSQDGTKYNKEDMIKILNDLSDDLDTKQVELLYIYYGSEKEYNEEWTLTVEEFSNYLYDNILQDTRFQDFIDDEMRENINNSKTTVNDAKEMLIGNEYSRLVINTKLASETEETFNFIQNTEDLLRTDIGELYIIGDSPMAYEMSKTFGDEFNYISILTMIAIFVVVVITFKSILIPTILVAVIQSAVYMIMGILSISGGSVYYLALLIVQSILMGSTIDYAILYTSYYLEYREQMDKKEALINAYNESIHTILTSATILIIVTFIVGSFATEITAKICMTLSQGTLCAEFLILVFLPALLATVDRFIIKKKKTKKI